MIEPIWWISLALAIAVIAAITISTPLRRARRQAEYERGRTDFHRRREHLEARFFSMASNSGKPRGLLWTDCSFEDDVTYARDKQSGALNAFVAVTISFEAKEGGLMEGVEAVGNLRAATARFRYTKGQWGTDGRAIFNLNPIETVAYYRDDLEMVGQEPAAHRSAS